MLSGIFQDKKANNIIKFVKCLLLHIKLFKINCPTLRIHSFKNKMLYCNTTTETERAGLCCFPLLETPSQQQRKMKEQAKSLIIQPSTNVSRVPLKAGIIIAMDPCGFLLGLPLQPNLCQLTPLRV